jgi:hypothetical protein
MLPPDIEMDYPVIWDLRVDTKRKTAPNIKKMGPQQSDQVTKSLRGLLLLVSVNDFCGFEGS